MIVPAALRSGGVRSAYGLCLVLACVAGCADAKSVQVYEGDRRPASEEIRLTVPPDIIVHKVNGANLPGRRPVLARYVSEVQFLPGSYELSLQYHEIWDDDTNDSEYETVTSSIITVPFVATEAGTYALIHSRPDSVREAKRYADSFGPSSVTFTRRSATPADRSEPALPAPANPAPAPRAAPPAEAAPPPESSAVPEIPDRQLMKYWWDQATPQEREAFLEWTRRQ